MLQPDEVFAAQEAKLAAGERDAQEIQEAVFLIAFFIGKTRFATPIERIREIVEDAAVTPLPTRDETYVGVLNLRGNLIPIMAPWKLAADAPPERGTAGGSQAIRYVVFETAGKDPFALEARDVRKVECQGSELHGNSDRFLGVIRIEGAPAHLLDFHSGEACRMLAAGRSAA